MSNSDNSTDSSTPPHHASMRRVIGQLPNVFVRHNLLDFASFLNAYYRLFSEPVKRAVLLDLIDIVTDAAAEAPVSSSDKPSFAPAEPAPAKHHIAYVIGHTAVAGGAYSETLRSGEYDYWQKVMAGFSFTGLTAMLTFSIHTRDAGTANAYKQALARKPSLIIELHFNASASPEAVGVETLAIAADTASWHVNSRLAAAAFSKAINRRTNSPLRQFGTGLKALVPGDRGYANLALAEQTPAILIEPFFGSNPKDSNPWRDMDFARKALAEATLAALRGIINHIEAPASAPATA